jgi:uncharacterized membrane protein
MKDILALIVGIIAIIAVIAIMYTIVGTIFYFGLPVLGVEVSFGQAIILTVLITVTGALFRGGSIGGKQTKEDE